MNTIITCNGVTVEFPSALISPPIPGAIVNDLGKVVSTLTITFVGEITTKQITAGSISLG